MASDSPRRPWFEAWAWFVDSQRDLSLANANDTSRIPPGGSPGYILLGVAGGLEVWENAELSLALENLTDENYRVHGSGVNGPGFNAILVLDMRF